jgi:hypothetical protein
VPPWIKDRSQMITMMISTTLKIVENMESIGMYVLMRYTINPNIAMVRSKDNKLFKVRLLPDDYITH